VESLLLRYGPVGSLRLKRISNSILFSFSMTSRVSIHITVHSGDDGVGVPQRLKPLAPGIVGGTAEAVPLSKSVRAFARMTHISESRYGAPEFVKPQIWAARPLDFWKRTRCVPPVPNGVAPKPLGMSRRASPIYPAPRAARSHSYVRLLRVRSEVRKEEPCSREKGWCRREPVASAPSGIAPNRCRGQQTTMPVSRRKAE
jgi:hypothetical protein